MEDQVSSVLCVVVAGRALRAACLAESVESDSHGTSVGSHPSVCAEGLSRAGCAFPEP